MKTILLLAGTLSLAYGVDLQERETIRQTFPAAARIEVDNVNGRIHVTGYNGNEIRMTAEKTIRAESEDRLGAAKRESLWIRIDPAIRSLSTWMDPFAATAAMAAMGSTITGSMAIP